MAEKYVKPEIVSLKKHAEFNEKWVQKIIEEDPSILGLGDLLLKDSERVQPSAGRLDLLLFDPESNQRYEVELQLGPTDESHIIRTIEYWDYERRRFPQYDHCAVIIAENITSRFLNVVSLFNGMIPLVAIQMQAVKIGDNISLVFSTVMDVLTLGTDEEEEGEPTDRKYWESRASQESLKLVDELVSWLQEIAPGYQPKYNKYYIGVSKDGVSRNFVSFTPRKSSVILSIRHAQDEAIQTQLDDSDLDVLSYDAQWKTYRVRLRPDDLDKSKEVLVGLMKTAYEDY